MSIPSWRHAAPSGRFRKLKASSRRVGRGRLALAGPGIALLGTMVCGSVVCGGEPNRGTPDPTRYDVLSAEPSLADRHRLLPGLRSKTLNQRDWPRTLHDDMASGFSPLCRGADGPPTRWADVDLGGGTPASFRIADADHDDLLIVDGALRRVTPAGSLVWTSSAGGTVVYYGTVPGEPLLAGEPSHPQSVPDRPILVLQAGAGLSILDASTGDLVWQHRFEPPHAQVRARVADIVPEWPGLEIAVVLAYAEEGALIRLQVGEVPELVWQRTVVVPGEFSERHDHGCGVEVDLSVPTRPILWNIRRYRCISVDARTGIVTGQLAYDIGGAPRRNYGPWALGGSSDRVPLIGVVSERVQLHVHAIRRRYDGPSELAWQHYYGEVYKGEAGVALVSLAIDDVDRDGATEMIYSVRDPEHSLRSFVRVRDLATGVVEWELPDTWGIGWVPDVDAVGTSSDRCGLLLTCPAPDGRMPRRGDLAAYRMQPTGAATLVATFSQARLWGSGLWEVGTTRQLVIQVANEPEQPALRRYAWSTPSELMAVAESTGREMQLGDPISVLRQHDGDSRIVMTTADGKLAGYDWEGNRHWTLPLRGGSPPALAAGDMTGDGRVELVALTPRKTARVIKFTNDGQALTLGDYPCIGRWAAFSPLLYDIDGKNRLCLITAVEDSEGDLAVAAIQGDGSRVWESPSLGLPAHDVASFVPIAGPILPGGAIGVSVSVRDDRATREGMYLLDGKTGAIRWFRGQYWRDGVVMPVRAHGIPTLYDVDHDGALDIGCDMLSYMALLRGGDGSFAFLHHGPNMSAEGALFAGRLYSTYVPLFRSVDDPTHTHWLAKGGFGPFGVMHHDVTTGIWRTDLEYDTPLNIGLIDVDADGELECGYAALHSIRFICRNVWTGEIEWQVDLPYAPNAPCMSADVDNDARGEFLIGPFCLGTSDGREGEIEWTAPASLGWGIVADLDGDGYGEFAAPRSGGVVVFK